MFLTILLFVAEAFLGIVITAKCFLNIDAIAKDVNKIDIEQALKKDDKKTA